MFGYFFVIAVGRVAIGKEINFLHPHFLRCTSVLLHFLKASKTIFFAAVCSKLGAFLWRKRLCYGARKNAFTAENDSLNTASAACVESFAYLCGRKNRTKTVFVERFD